MTEQKPLPDHIQDIALRDALEERYLAYALSTITQRALPDVRDGLKPVHRRLLYAMRELRLNPQLPHKKSARVVGDVIGKFHPHGDQSVYDALVRLAQDFAERYPLVDGQGNFGNVDGDSAAAMRYTEARMTDIAALLLESIDENAVDFRPTYDGSEEEPIVLPAAFPNLLANGSMGIAVGMATSIPPHNIGELCAASLHLIDHPNADTDALLAHVKGPDFPTGGIIIENHETIAEAYRTGRGSLRVRARWHEEAHLKLGKVIVITEIPYQIQKSRLIERLANFVEERKLPLVAEVRDESSDDIRVVIEPRSRGLDLNVVMESVFRASDLESRMSFNMNVLVDGRVPMVLGLADLLRQWLQHRRVVTVRIAQHRLDGVLKRLDIVEGLLIVYLDLDRVIRIIREEDEPKPALIKAFSLNDTQAEAILNTRLRSLRRLEEMELKRERETLLSSRKELEKLLGSETAQWAHVRKEISDLAARFHADSPLGRRRTTFAEAPKVQVLLPEQMIEREPITVILSQKGWLRTLKGHVSETTSLLFKADDALHTLLQTSTADKILAIASDGKVFTLDAHKLPSGRGFGDPVRLHMDLGEGEDILSLHVASAQSDARYLFAAKEGRGFIVDEKDMLSATKRGKQVMVLSEGQRLHCALPVRGDTVAVFGENRKLLLFPVAEVVSMTRGRGVRLQRYKDGAMLDIQIITASDGLVYKDSAGGDINLKTLDLYKGHRAEAGRTVPRGFKGF